jgi:hypothetical protein
MGALPHHRVAWASAPRARIQMGGFSKDILKALSRKREWVV